MGRACCPQRAVPGRRMKDHPPYPNKSAVQTAHGVCGAIILCEGAEILDQIRSFLRGEALKQAFRHQGYRQCLLRFHIALFQCHRLPGDGLEQDKVCLAFHHETGLHRRVIQGDDAGLETLGNDL